MDHDQLFIAGNKNHEFDAVGSETGEPISDSIPLSPLEGALAGLWASVLHLPQVARDDNFFLIGGDSLQGTQLCAQIKALFSVDLPMESLFADAGTVAGMAAMIEDIRSENSRANGLNALAEGAPASSGIPLRKTKSPAVLSHTQWRSWFLARFDPANPAYNESRAYRLTGPVNAGLLAASLRALIERHEILRTNFVTIDGEARQVVHDQGILDFRVLDFSTEPPAAKDEAVSKALADITQAPFNLEKGPLSRFALLQTGDEECVFLRVWQHIIGDGWSAGVFDRELSSVYSSLAKGDAADLLPLPVQYADYAVWQRQWLSGERFERELRYWKDNLEDVPTLRLPIDLKRPPVQSNRGASFELTLPRDLTESLRALGLAEDATLFMTLLAAFQVFLHRYSGDDDISVGTPIAGRRHAELEGLIGFFANTLVLRTKLDGEPTFRELLARTRKTALSAYENQDVPFDKIVEELAPARDTSRNPLFQVLFALQNMPATDLAFPAIQSSRVSLPTRNAKFDLALTLREGAPGVQARWEYCSDLFERATIERMAANFQVLLEAIVGNPDQRIGRLPLLSPAERLQLEVNWNDTATEYPRGSCIHTLFEAQAARTPAATAVFHAGMALSYSELNQRANRLAHYLRANGVMPGVLVAICAERDLDLIVALLGVLKAGGAYVPMDPELPRERLAFMLQDADVTLVLTEKKLLGRLPESSSRSVCLDADWEQISSCSNSNPVSNALPQQPAYVIYTSGSTGKPKGACITHRNVVNYLIWSIEAGQMKEGSSVPVFSSIAFDLAVPSLFGPLLAGKTVHLLSSKQIGDSLGQALLDAGAGFSLLVGTPAHLMLVQQAVDTGAAGLAHTIVLGGEQLYGESLEFWREQAPQTTIFNEYGPTETTMACAAYKVNRETPKEGPVPIGRPIANTRLYILDRYGESVPIGVAGELHVAGDGVGLGYWRRPELTAERFLPDRFSREPGALAYRTGDLARYLPDGNIVFLGRLDTQVKLRGFRIELGEIEAVIAEHPGVSHAAVLVREELAANKSLVAYIVSAGEQCPTFEQLRDLLRKRLPEHMLPSSLVVLDRFPLMANGKVDRRALANLQGREVRATREYVAPRDETERTICRFWEEVLGVERVGLDDNFFEIGGHSLLATRLFAKLDDEFDRTVPLGALFAAPTVRALAELYRAPEVPEESNGHAALVALTTGGSLPPLFAAPGGQGNVVGFAEFASKLGPDQPFYAFQSVGLDGKQAPLDSIEAMAGVCVEDIRRVQPHGPYALIGFCFGAVVAYEIARQMLDAGEQVAFLGLLDPSRFAGSKANELSFSGWRPYKRLLALGAFVEDRMRLYASEMRHLGLRDRFRYVFRKTHVLSRLIEKHGPSNGIERELNQIEVYRANILALERYRGEPLNGRLPSIEVFEVEGRAPDNEPTPFRRLWEGNCRRHLVPGNRVGESVRGAHADYLADLLATRLRAAFGETSSPQALRPVMVASRVPR